MTRKLVNFHQIVEQRRWHAFEGGDAFLSCCYGNYKLRFLHLDGHLKMERRVRCCTSLSLYVIIIINNNNDLLTAYLQSSSKIC